MSEATELSSIAGSALTARPRPGGRRFPGSVPGDGTWRRLLDERLLAGPQRALLLRLHEISVGVCYAPRPLLMATPSGATGLIDPDELLARLERAATEGWEPWARDLEQALLRLPCDAGSDVARRARRLGTPAAERLAAWLDGGGLPAPEVVRTVAPAGMIADGWGARTRGPVALPRTLAAIRPRPDTSGAPGMMTALLSELAEPQRWLGQDASEAVWEDSHPAGWLACWPAMLPAYRDVVAAHLVPLFARGTVFRRSAGTRFDPLLPLLAAADGAGGPPGPGLRLALGYGLAALDQAARAAAVRALIILAGRGQLDGAALGHEIGELAARGDVLLTGVVPALQAAREAGAGVQVWALIAAALPHLLPPAAGRAPQRLADLIALGAAVAEQIRPGGTIPGLAAVAGRAGSTRYVAESRRLLTILNGRLPPATSCSSR
jgi:hypothetical protein